MFNWRSHSSSSKIRPETAPADISEMLSGSSRPQLQAMLPGLLFAMLVPYIGPRAGAEEMRRVAATR